MLTDTAKEFIRLYAQDVKNNPEAYKLSVSANSESAALNLIENLSDEEAKQLLKYFKHEIRSCTPSLPSS